jgi:phosphoglycolate phosphatase
MSEYIDEHIKAVFFDHDDTLVGTIDAKWAHHKHVAQTFYGKELTDDEIRPHWGKPLGELVCLLYGTDDVEQAMAHNTATHEAYPKELFTATIPTLRHIKAAGLIVGVITATTRFSFEHDLDLHKIPRDLIDYTQTADDTSYHKPDPRVFEPALAWLTEQQIKPDEVMYIGDGLHDMKAALGAGFSFLGVETGLVTAEQFVEQDAKSIASISALYGV